MKPNVKGYSEYGFDHVAVIGNSSQYYDYCWQAPAQAGKVKFFIGPIPLSNRVLRKIYWELFMKTSGWAILMKKFLAVIICHSLGLKRDKRNLVIIYDFNMLSLDLPLLKKLQQYGPVIYRLSNPLKRSYASSQGFSNNLMTRFNGVCSFDFIDAEQNGFLYWPFVYEPLIDNFDLKQEYDLFFVGAAKDRLAQIHEIYENATAQGLKCDFHIVDVNENEKKHTGISYNQRLSYRETLERTLKSRCIVDVIQGESSGLTLRISEAIFFNKKVITTNPNITRDSCCREGNFLIYKPGADLKTFLNTPTHYTAEDKASRSAGQLIKALSSYLSQNGQI